ncbi:hypothetical protein JB92DRAFT_2886584 [Gautieria morchelliformis]|nr:hypothetical protein JB92DRAFT_2886584 [Gautieria morchelliformis]
MLPYISVELCFPLLMSPATPQTDLWLERSRFNGMLLGSVSYGMFLTLTIEATLALLRQRRKKRTPLKSTSTALLGYLAITFALATIGFGGNAKYTQMIWIDLRDASGGPPLLIQLELDHWINRMALASYYIMEEIMDVLLLYRCFVIWNKNPIVIIFMTTLFLATVAMAILVLTDSRGAAFYNINFQLAYLCTSVGTNITYTILVAGRIYATRNRVKALVGKQHAEGYTSVIAMVIESAAMYSTLAVLYIIAFATNSNFSNLIFLAISHVQGIAQLLIILRVANGQAYTTDMGSQANASTMRFYSEPHHPPDFRLGSSSTAEMGPVSTKTKLSTNSNLQPEASRESVDAVI